MVQEVRVGFRRIEVIFGQNICSGGQRRQGIHSGHLDEVELVPGSSQIAAPLIHDDLDARFGVQAAHKISVVVGHEVDRNGAQLDCQDGLGVALQRHTHVHPSSRADDKHLGRVQEQIGRFQDAFLKDLIDGQVRLAFDHEGERVAVMCNAAEFKLLRQILVWDAVEPSVITLVGGCGVSVGIHAKDGGPFRELKLSFCLVYPFFLAGFELKDLLDVRPEHNPCRRN